MATEGAGATLVPGQAAEALRSSRRRDAATNLVLPNGRRGSGAYLPGRAADAVTVDWARNRNATRAYTRLVAAHVDGTKLLQSEFSVEETTRQGK